MVAVNVPLFVFMAIDFSLFQEYKYQIYLQG